MGDFVPNLYKTGTIKRCESRSSRVDQEVCMYVCNSLIYEKTDTIYLATPN